MEDLIPKWIFHEGDFDKQWEVKIVGIKTIHTAKVEDAKIGIADQHNKEHIMVFKKGATLEQWREGDQFMTNFSGLKRFEYSGKDHHKKKS